MTTNFEEVSAKVGLDFDLTKDTTEIKTEIDSHIPYILNGELYQIQKQEGENVTVKCCNCPPDRVYRGSVRSTGNFHMHIKRRHPDLLAKLHEMKVTSILQRRDRFVKRRKPKKSNPPMATRNKVKKEPEDIIKNSSNMHFESYVHHDLKIKSVFQKHQMQKQLQQQQQQQQQQEQKQKQEDEKQQLVGTNVNMNSFAPIEAQVQEQKQQTQQQLLLQQKQQQHQQQQYEENQNLNLNQNGVKAAAAGSFDSRKISSEPLDLVLNKVVLKKLETTNISFNKNNTSFEACQSYGSQHSSPKPSANFLTSHEAINDLIPQEHLLFNSTASNQHLNRFTASPTLSTLSAISYHNRSPEKNSIKREYNASSPNVAIDLSLSKPSSSASSGICVSSDETSYNFNHRSAGTTSHYCDRKCPELLQNINATLKDICDELNLRNRIEIAKFKYIHPDFNWTF